MEVGRIVWSLEGAVRIRSTSVGSQMCGQRYDDTNRRNNKRLSGRERPGNAGGRRVAHPLAAVIRFAESSALVV